MCSAQTYIMQKHILDAVNRNTAPIISHYVHNMLVSAFSVLHSQNETQQYWIIV